MYEFIEGKVVQVSTDSVVIANQGIGYLIYCPNPYQFTQNQSATIYTHHYVREDAINLYGFKSREERQLFVQLLGVSGIGPKGALAVLATGETARVIEAIETEDERYLVQFPGIGKKTARQIILDLKGKFKSVSGPAVKQIDDTAPDSARHAMEEAFQALQALGYSEKEITRISPELKGKELTTEGYIKQALQLLLKG
ncbi:Holliday junction branch migration protein RuvA [Pullulanibacillus sp. KACC 23026]|uniref:Holliday junction branch migration protein RuvA n=1 Tax=Pullulanibacillus sp. KACC 23026 TaxID=3028315 RepID=UPI0023B08814|nr:Holliday junction branch migration protein RuvA [Pullulanibacillus sp. KACC 23026]WEG14068.1 Holliday junction branch migration protein RuvA [Pullulanibacillus sp. KACC 23026]